MTEQFIFPINCRIILVLMHLTLPGFFTSEPGATRVARSRPVPGK